MPTFGLLGATGQVGGAILAELVKDETVKVRCLVRSSKKLYKSVAIDEAPAMVSC